MTDEDVYRKHAGELLRFASGLVGPDDAQDLLSETCIDAFTSATWPMVENKRAYLFRTMLNRSRMRHRSTMRRRARELRAAAADGSEEISVDVDVLRAVGSLSIRQRAVVFLTFWHDLAEADIAELLAISPGSVRRHLHRGKSRLREELR